MDNISFEEMVELLGLADVIKYRNEHNPSGNLPYHGNKHLNFMLADCFNSYIYHNAWKGDNTPITDSYTTFAIFYAAIFHDIDHSGGKHTDDINIDKAIIAWRTFVNSSVGESCVVGAHTRPGEMLRLIVPVLIRATQYPYVDILESSEYREYADGQKCHTTSIVDACNILRDADLMSIYHGDEGLELINRGLYKEMSSDGSIYGPMTYEAFVKNSAAFLHNIQWSSEWGKRRAAIMNFPKLVEDALSDAELINQLETFKERTIIVETPSTIQELERK